MSTQPHTLTYDVYLRSPLWRLRRRIWILRAGVRCERCGTRRQLTIHHRTYKRLAHERREDIHVLCWPCHQLVQHGTASARRIVPLRVGAAVLFFAFGAYALGQPAATPRGVLRGHDKLPIGRHRHSVPNPRRPGLFSLRPDSAPPPARSLQGRRLPSPHPTGSVPLGRTAARTGLVQTTRIPKKEEP